MFSLPSPRVPLAPYFSSISPSFHTIICSLYNQLFIVSARTIIPNDVCLLPRDAGGSYYVPPEFRRHGNENLDLFFSGSLKKKRDIVSCGPMVQSEPLLIFMKSVDEIVPIRQMTVH